MASVSIIMKLIWVLHFLFWLEVKVGVSLHVPECNASKKKNFFHFICFFSFLFLCISLSASFYFLYPRIRPLLFCHSPSISYCVRRSKGGRFRYNVFVRQHGSIGSWTLDQPNVVGLELLGSYFAYGIAFNVRLIHICIHCSYIYNTVTNSG